VALSALLKAERRWWEVQWLRQFETHDEAQRPCCNLCSWLNAELGSSPWELVWVFPSHSHRDSDKGKKQTAFITSAGW